MRSNYPFPTIWGPDGAPFNLDVTRVLLSAQNLSATAQLADFLNTAGGGAGTAPIDAIDKTGGWIKTVTGATTGYDNTFTTNGTPFTVVAGSDIIATIEWNFVGPLANTTMAMGLSNASVDVVGASPIGSLTDYLSFNVTLATGVLVARSRSASGTAVVSATLATLAINTNYVFTILVRGNSRADFFLNSGLVYSTTTLPAAGVRLQGYFAVEAAASAASTYYVRNGLWSQAQRSEQIV